MQTFLDKVSKWHRGDRIAMVLDGAGWHRGRGLAVPENMRLLRLPPYSPELNPAENIRDELREKFFGNVVFDSMDALERRLVKGLRHLWRHPEVTRSISSWSWIINTLPI